MPLLPSSPDWAAIRSEFFLPPSQIYLDGNSLGLLSRPAQSAVLRVLADWGTRGIGGWSEAGWIDLAERIGAQLSPLLGASPTSLCLAAQTTVNLHQLVATVFDPTHASRRVIVADALNFASDTQALTSYLRQHQLDPTTHLRLIASRDGFTLHPDDIIAALTDDVQLVILPSVLYVSGQLLNLKVITAAARARGILVGWDLSHSIGAVPHALESDGADFAFWCNYKYLNAGPGAIGGLFLHPRHHDRAPGLAGWWGVHPEDRFALRSTHTPAVGAARLQIGTPHILSLAPLLGSLELFDRAGGIDPIRQRSLELTSHFLARAEQDLTPLGFSIVTPRAPDERGGHIALTHPSAGQICQALRALGVVPDFRAPAVIRFAPTALYNTFAEIDQALDHLVNTLTTEAHLAFPSPATASP
jgi:kynureninase